MTRAQIDDADRLVFRPLVTGSGGGTIVAYLDRRGIAQYGTCPRGWCVQWHHLQHPHPDHCEFVGSEAAARQLISDWVAGLDIVPWGE